MTAAGGRIVEISKQRDRSRAETGTRMDTRRISTIVTGGPLGLGAGVARRIASMTARKLNKKINRFIGETGMPSRKNPETGVLR